MVISMNSCSLDNDPISNEAIPQGSDTTGSVKYKTRAEMLVQYNGIYNILKGNNLLENWNLDLLVMTETHADNAYRGATDAELPSWSSKSKMG